MSCYESQGVTGSAGRVTELLEMAHDTREKLEEDVRQYANPSGGTGTLGACWEQRMLEFLDRQAAITEKACADFWQEIAEDRDRAQMKCSELCDQVDVLTTERDHWKDAFEDSERLRLELVEELEKRDKGIRRLKQRRGELMDEVRHLGDELAKARRDDADDRALAALGGIAGKYRADSLAAQAEAERYRRLLGCVLDAMDGARADVARGLSACRE